MSHVTSTQPHAKAAARKPSVVLARAIWRDQLKERGFDVKAKDVVLADWKDKQKEYLALSRRILRHLEREGFELAPKA